MTGPHAAAVYAASYAPNSESLRQSLPEIGDGLQSQLVTLYADPSPRAAEALASNLAGAQRAVLRYREALLREGTGDAQCDR